MTRPPGAAFAATRHPAHGRLGGTSQGQPARVDGAAPRVDDISTGGELPMKDGSMLAQVYAPTKHTVKFIAKTDLPGITAIRLELLTDPNLPSGGRLNQQYRQSKVPIGEV